MLVDVRAGIKKKVGVHTCRVSNGGIMSYLKHNGTNGKSKQRAAKKPDEPLRVVMSAPEREPGSLPPSSIQHDLNYVAGLDGIEGSLDWIAKGLQRLTDEDFTVNLTLAQGSNIHPIKLTLAENDFDDTMGRLVTAFERIADSLARLAGLSRPRLEDWHEQNEYTPRYKDAVSESGAPNASQQGVLQKS